MKNLKLALLLLISICLVSCDNDPDNTNPNENKPQQTDDEIINQLTEVEIMAKIQDVINKKDNYYIETIGKTNTKVLIKYEQKTQTKTYFDKDYVFSDISSKSYIVSRYHKVYSSKDLVSYYDSEKSSDENDILLTTRNAYLDDFGIIHSKENFFDLIINDNTIITSKKGKIGDMFVLEIELKEEATEKLKIQMKEFGSLRSYPKFKKIVLTIKFNKDFEVLCYDSYQEYSINIAVLGTTNCTQNLTSIVKYDNYEKPNIDMYIKKAQKGFLFYYNAFSLKPIKSFLMTFKSIMSVTIKSIYTVF